MNIKEIEKLIEKAKMMAEKNDCCPHSKFTVGAALLTKEGKVYLGTNVENCGYGPSNCAERSALFSVYSMGFRKEDIVRILIVGDTKTPVSPCGACRQVISELMEKDSEVVLTNLNKDCLIYKVSELLPYSFTEGDLNE